MAVYVEFKQPQLKKEYEERVEQLREIAKSPALRSSDAMWDVTVRKYAETVSRLQKLLEQDELKKDFAAVDREGDNVIDLGRQLQGFLAKCTDSKFHIALVGTIKAGKSSLINAFLGEQLASTEVTPETASLTKFLGSKGEDYIEVNFYSSSEWNELWNSVKNSKKDTSTFMDEYKELHADMEKNRWVAHETIRKECSSREELKEEIKKWSSSRSAVHYFVKDVIVGLKNFELPEGMVLVDTPGLNDAVSYRSEITKDYIARANAVLVCVKADKLTSQELSFISGVFSNSRENRSKIYIIATQQDTLNDPIKDWAKLRKNWLSHLQTRNYFGEKIPAEKNLLSTSGYFYLLLKQKDKLDKKQTRILQRMALGLDCNLDEIPKRFDELLTFTGIQFLKDQLNKEIVSRYRKLLMEDIKGDYKQYIDTIKEELDKIREKQTELLDSQSKGLEEMKRRQQENQKKLEDAKKNQKEFEDAVRSIEKMSGILSDDLVKKIQEQKEKIR